MLKKCMSGYDADLLDTDAGDVGPDRAGTGHTAGGTGCGVRMIRAFLTKGNTEGLDISCMANVKRPRSPSRSRKRRVT